MTLGELSIRKKILILDDDQEDVDILSHHLGNCPKITPEITAVASIEAARQAMQAEAFDAVFMDYRLRGAKGTELIDHAEEMPGKPRLILFSGNEHSFMDRDAMQRMRSGQVRFMSKRNITPQELFELLVD